MTKRDIVIFLFKRLKSLFGYWFLVIGLSVFLVYFMPQKYQAVGKILIESNRAPVMRSDVAFGVEQLNVINSEVAIIRSQPVFAETANVIQRIKTAKQDRDEEPARQGSISLFVKRISEWMIEVGLREKNSPREQLIGQLENNLKISPQPASNVIAISYQSSDPELAATVVNTVIKNYINHHLGIYSSLGTVEVYRLQIKRLEDDLGSRRAELSDYKRENSVSALNETRQALVQQQTRMTAEIDRLEAELAELLTRFGSGHTKVVLVEERLRSAHSALEATSKRLQKLEVVETAIRNMEIEINSAELTLQNYKKLFQDEQLLNLANPEVVNVLVIEDAVVPSRPEHSRLYYILLATIGGLFLSFAIAFIKEYFDNRVTDPRVASQLLGVPTLGSIEKARAFWF